MRRGGNVKLEDLKMYIIVDKDLEISKSKLAGQVGHASMRYLYSKIISNNMGKIDKYMEKEKKIILRGTLNQLLKLEQDNDENNLGYAVIRDRGITELEPNTLTCICVGISGIDDVPKLVNKLQLYR